MGNLKLNTSYKHHLIVALVIGLWLASFLVLIAPFDASDLSFSIRLRILPLYGIISFMGYMILVPVQNWVFKKLGKWYAPLEITFIVLFNILVLLGSFTYYKTDIINGTYSFAKFTFQVYYPIFFIILPIVLFLRWWLNRKGTGENSNKIVLRGANKLDVLHICLEDLVSISSADNYVEVNYLENDTLEKATTNYTQRNTTART